MQTIYYWPDGTWCTKEEYSEAAYGWKSDDIGKIEMSAEASDGEIDTRVLEEVS